MQNTTKKFIGGLVVGIVLGLIAGGFTVASLFVTAFINANLIK